MLGRNQMKYIKFSMPIIILCFIVTACAEKVYPPIASDQSIIITINIKDMTISFVDGERHEVIEQWEMEKPYSGGMILPDKDTLLLYGKHIETVDLYSLSKGKYMKSWNTGKGIANGRVLQNQKEIVFVDQVRNLARFFTIDGEETKAISTNQNPFTILEGKDKLYVINLNDEELTIIDKEKKVNLDSINIHSNAAGALLRESNNELWIGGHGTGTQAEPDIHIYNLEDGSLNNTIQAPLMPVNFIEKDGTIYVISHGSNTLYKIPENVAGLKSVQVGANPFEISFFQDELIVAGYDSNDIYFVDPNSLQIKHQVNVGKGPFQLIVRESK